MLIIVEDIEIPIEPFRHQIVAMIDCLWKYPIGDTKISLTEWDNLAIRQTGAV